MYMDINNPEMKPKTDHWTFSDFRGYDINVSLDDLGDMATFHILINNGEETRKQDYEVYTNGEFKRRIDFLDNGKCPCGKWNDRAGNRICFENALSI